MFANSGALFLGRGLGVAVVVARTDLLLGAIPIFIL
jgi:hypothetical protein